VVGLAAGTAHQITADSGEDNLLRPLAVTATGTVGQPAALMLGAGPAGAILGMA
jgi:hypothetical protein